MDRSTRLGLTMSIGEWVCWKLRRPTASARLLVRSAAHQIVFHSTRLGLLYQAIPHNVTSADDVRRFWIDIHHTFILDTVWEWFIDADQIVADLVKQETLGHDEIQRLIDGELRTADWAGIFITYSVWSPEVRGLLLALTLGRAQGRTVPSLIENFATRLTQQGYSQWGTSLTLPRTRKINDDST
ncbi:MAG: hypothetical protein WD226_08105 [Planctomycetota bacterium]